MYPALSVRHDCWGIRAERAIITLVARESSDAARSKRGWLAVSIISCEEPRYSRIQTSTASTNRSVETKGQVRGELKAPKVHHGSRQPGQARRGVLRRVRWLKRLMAARNILAGRSHTASPTYLPTSKQRYSRGLYTQKKNKNKKKSPL